MQGDLEGLIPLYLRTSEYVSDLEGLFCAKAQQTEASRNAHQAN